MARAEGETTVRRVAARERIGDRRQEQGTRMGGHMQTVRNKRDRPEHQSASDFGDHHCSAESDNPPGPPFVGVVTFAQNDRTVRRTGRKVRHGQTHLR